jgi:hypothetical protein
MLYYACINDHKLFAEELLMLHKIDTNTSDKEGRNPVYFAVKNNNFLLAQSLIQF